MVSLQSRHVRHVATERNNMNTTITTEIIGEAENRSLKVTLGDDIFYLPFKLIAGKWVGFLDISGQFILNECAADFLVDIFEKKGMEFDTIVNPVSKSNALAHAIAVRWAKKHPELTHTVVARKSSDPSNPVQATYKSVTTASMQTLALTADDAAFIKGKKVLLVDDVFGGGGTTKALRELMDRAGAEVAVHAVIGVEEGANFPEDLVYLFTLPVLDK